MLVCVCVVFNEVQVNVIFSLTDLSAHFPSITPGTSVTVTQQVIFLFHGKVKETDKILR